MYAFPLFILILLSLRKVLCGQGGVGNRDHSFLTGRRGFGFRWQCPWRSSRHGYCRGITTSCFSPSPTGSPVLPGPARAQVSGLVAERVTWHSVGFSETVFSTTLAAKRRSPRVIYVSRRQVFADWCEERQFSASCGSVPGFLESLQHLAQRGLNLNTIKGYAMAVSSRHVLVAVGREHVLLCSTFCPHLVSRVIFPASAC